MRRLLALLAAVAALAAGAAAGTPRRLEIAPVHADAAARDAKRLAPRFSAHPDSPVWWERPASEPYMPPYWLRGEAVPQTGTARGTIPVPEGVMPYWNPFDSNM